MNARPLTETQIQRPIVQWLETQRLVCLWRHVSHTYDSPQYGRKLKLLGCKAGWPDFDFLFPGGNIAFIELKKKKGVLSEEQKAFRDWCLSNGTLWALVKTDEPTEAINQFHHTLRLWGAYEETTTNA